MFTYRFASNPQRGNALTLHINSHCSRASLSLGLALPPADLADAQSVAPAPRNLRWASMLAHWESAITDYRLDLALRGSDPSAAEVRDALRALLLPERPAAPEKEKAAPAKKEKARRGTLMKFYDERIDRYARESSRLGFLQTGKIIRELMPGVDALDFEDIGYAWLCSFNEAMERRGLAHNTRWLHLSRLRTCCNDAYARELTDADPFRRFRFGARPTRKRSLDVDDLRRLMALPLEGGQARARDYFMIVFGLIGINSVDLYPVTGLTRDGRLEYDRSKTGRHYSIRVEPEVAELIKRYRGRQGTLLDAAERYSTHASFGGCTNNLLQSITGEDGRPLWPGLTLYWARHTWATIARRLKVSKDDIALALGHGPRTVTDTYIDEDLDAVDEANRRVIDWVWHGIK